jgi:hypothetical protein
MGATSYDLTSLVCELEKMDLRDIEVRCYYVRCAFHTGHEASRRADSLAQRPKCQLDCGSPSVA